MKDETPRFTVASSVRSLSNRKCPRANGTTAVRRLTRMGTSTPASSAGTLSFNVSSPELPPVRVVRRNAIPPPTTHMSAPRFPAAAGEKRRTTLPIVSRCTVSQETVWAHTVRPYWNPLRTPLRLSSAPTVRCSPTLTPPPTVNPGAMPPNGSHRYGQSLLPSTCIDSRTPPDAYPAAGRTAGVVCAAARVAEKRTKQSKVTACLQHIARFFRD